MRPNKQGLYKCIVPLNKAKVGIKFNTIPNISLDDYLKNPGYDFEIVKVTKTYFSACNKNDCKYVLARYIGKNKN